MQNQEATVKNDIGKTTFKVSNLVPGTEYYFRVTAVNAFGPGVPKATQRSYLASDPISKYYVYSSFLKLLELLE